MSKTVIKKCKICDAHEGHQVVAALVDEFLAIKCPQCGVVSGHPIPSIETLTNYYKSYHATAELPERLTQLVDLNKGIADYLIEKVGKTDKLTILDYGFGVGAFVKQIMNRCQQVVGVDFSEQNCHQLKKYCTANSVRNVEVIKTPEETPARLDGRYFDLITLFQVIEHLTDPLQLLFELSLLQQKDGFLYIECPNNDALYLKIKNTIRLKIGRESFYDSINPPHHLYGFNRRSIQILLDRAGYNILEIGDYHFGHKIHQVETQFWYPTLKELVRNKRRHNFYGISKTLIGTLDPIASIIFRAGGGLFVLAQKRCGENDLYSDYHIKRRE